MCHLPIWPSETYVAVGSSKSVRSTFSCVASLSAMRIASDSERAGSGSEWEGGAPACSADDASPSRTLGISTLICIMADHNIHEVAPQGYSPMTPLIRYGFRPFFLGSGSAAFLLVPWWVA